ncbi:uncharacterized protein L969DRAFT_21640 [Mixia osmundae IAM 14324]|nr:uncharacterized protein L969DRAFT_21640 [Mixia osmundae IAM 14324]KEI42775.1 hypothetical protein L969DRAFT_21640 [Mixia osmundae IAM 14324]
MSGAAKAASSLANAHKPVKIDRWSLIEARAGSLEPIYLQEADSSVEFIQTRQRHRQPVASTSASPYGESGTEHADAANDIEIRHTRLKRSPSVALIERVERIGSVKPAEGRESASETKRHPGFSSARDLLGKQATTEASEALALPPPIDAEAWRRKNSAILVESPTHIQLDATEPSPRQSHFRDRIADYRFKKVLEKTPSPREMRSNPFSTRAQSPVVLSSDPTPPIAQAELPQREPKRARRLPDKVFVPSIMNVLVSCPVCLAIWQSRKSAAKKTDHVKACADQHGHTQDQVIAEMDRQVLRLKMEHDQAMRATATLLDSVLADRSATVDQMVLEATQGPKQINGTHKAKLNQLAAKINDKDHNAASKALDRAVRAIQKSGRQTETLSFVETVPVEMPVLAVKKQQSHTPEALPPPPATQAFAPSKLTSKYAKKSSLFNAACQDASHANDIDSAKEPTASSDGVTLLPQPEPITLDTTDASMSDSDVPMQTQMVKRRKRKSDQQTSPGGIADAISSMGIEPPSTPPAPTSRRTTKSKVKPLVAPLGSPASPAMPDYDAWTLEALQIELAQYGYKKSKSKKATIERLVAVWHANQASRAAKSGKKKRTVSPTKRKAASPRKRKSSKTPSIEEVPTDEEDVEGSQEPMQTVAHQIYQLVRYDPVLWPRLLRYEPLCFEDVHGKIKAAGIKSSLLQTREFLDDQAITHFSQSAIGPRTGKGRGRR